MNEQDWLAGTLPKWMLEHVRAGASERKLRLFACASLRTVPGIEEVPGCVHLLGVAERYADGEVLGGGVLAALRRASVQAFQEQPRDIALYGQPRAWAEGTLYLVDPNAWRAAHAYIACFNHFRAPPGVSYVDTLALYGRLLHCLFGNPFRPVPRDAPWPGFTQVRQLAEVIDRERRFDELPVLADALEDAGCDHAGAIDHCRGGGPHAHGCWVVDRILGRN